MSIVWSELITHLQGGFMNQAYIIKAILNKDHAIAQVIDSLTNAERISIRNAPELAGKPIPRNLYFNYTTQVWIEE